MVETAHAMGYRALAVTDIDEIGHVVRAHEAAKKLEMSLLIGTELTVLDPGAPPIVLIAKHRRGYANLCRLLTHAKRSRPRGDPGIAIGQIASRAEGLLAMVTGPCELAHLSPLKRAFGDDLSIAVARNYSPGEDGTIKASRALSDASGVPLVATGSALYHDPSRKPLADVLAAVRNKTSLAAGGYQLLANGERHLQRPSELINRFTTLGLSSAIDRSMELASRCDFSMDELRFIYPEKHLPAGETPITWFRATVLKGARERFGDPIPTPQMNQLTHELDLIERMRVEGFFLTMFDIVSFARSRGILCQGRGSAANSSVCYALGITSVDPVSSGLLFERFLSEERGEPPDIDVDFEHERREEVIQWVYNFYGRENAGLVCENICYRPRSAVRDVGKALGMSADQVDRLAKTLGHFSREALLDDNRFLEAGVDPKSPMAEQLRYVLPQLLGFVRHRGTHVGGMVVTNEPLIDTAPLEDAAMANRTILPWDKDDCDILGMCKFDLLGLGMLTCIRKCFDLVRHTTGNDYTLANLPQGDAITYERVSAGDTVGCFQIESRAQMSMLPKLRPERFYDLVITISIIRPGPIQGGMVHPYLRRRNGEEPITFPHPSLIPILARTLGVPLFQEQVMRMAVEVAGFTPGEADELRRKMGAWRRRGSMDDVKKRLVGGMTSRGISEQYAEQIFKQIQGFGEYGFPESHAISFALLAYASIWLKTHYPAAYVCALLNSQPMGFYSAHTLVEDSRRHGVRFYPIDVTLSHWDCTLEHDGQGYGVRVGVRYVRGLGSNAEERFEAARQVGRFKTVEDVAVRTGLSRDAMAAMAHAGAFRSLSMHAASGGSSALDRRSAFWEVLRPRGERPTLALTDDPLARFEPMTTQDEVRADYEVTGLSPTAHPISFLRPRFTERGVCSVRELATLRDGQVAQCAGLIIGRQHPQTAKGFVFLSLEDETGLLNVIISPQLFERQRLEITRYPLLLIQGTVQNRVLGSTSLKAEWVQPIVNMDNVPILKSRDFR